MPNLFRTLFHSLVDPAVYLELASLRLRRVLWYTLSCYVLLSAILAIYLTFRFLTPLKQSVQSTLTALESNYPQDLVLTLSNNQLTAVGTVLPYTPTASASDSIQIALFPDYAQATLPRFPDPLTLPYSQLNLSGSLDAATAQKYLAEVRTGIDQLTLIPVILTLSLGFLLFYLPLRLIYALITAVLFYFLSKLQPHPYPFTMYLKLILPALVAAETVNVLTTMIYTRPTPIVFTLAFLGYTFVAVYSVAFNKNQ